MKSVTFSTMENTERVRAPHLADWAMSRGITALTTAEAAAHLQVSPDQVRVRLAAPRTRGQWVNPTHGLWVPVPPQYQLWGAPPGIELVDILLKHLGVEYYVGWLSAAARYGATHQAVQVFQVAVSAPVRDRKVGRTQFHFYRRQRVEHAPIHVRNVDSGTVRVATIATTALDVANDIIISGGLSNVATVIIELAEHPEFRVDEIAALADDYPAAAGRRIGWILEEFTGRDDLETLRGAVLDRTARPSRLSPWGDAPGEVNDRWALAINDEIEEES